MTIVRYCARVAPASNQCCTAPSQRFLLMMTSLPTRQLYSSEQPAENDGSSFASASVIVTSHWPLCPCANTTPARGQPRTSLSARYTVLAKWSIEPTLPRDAMQYVMRVGSAPLDCAVCFALA